MRQVQLHLDRDVSTRPKGGPQPESRPISRESALAAGRSVAPQRNMKTCGFLQLQALPRGGIMEFVINASPQEFAEDVGPFAGVAPPSLFPWLLNISA